MLQEQARGQADPRQAHTQTLPLSGFSTLATVPGSTGRNRDSSKEKDRPQTFSKAHIFSASARIKESSLNTTSSCPLLSSRSSWSESLCSSSEDNEALEEESADSDSEMSKCCLLWIASSPLPCSACCYLIQTRLYPWITARVRDIAATVLASTLLAPVGADARLQALLASVWHLLAVMLAYLQSPAFLAMALAAIVGADARPQALLALAPNAVMLAYVRSPPSLHWLLRRLCGQMPFSTDARPQALRAR